MHQLLSEVTECDILQFLHQMFNVSALLLDDALLKCVVTKVLFSIVGDINISQGSVATHFRCGGIFSNSIITNVLIILTLKNSENGSIFNEVIRRIKSVPNFWVTMYASQLLVHTRVMYSSLKIPIKFILVTVSPKKKKQNNKIFQ